MNLQEAENLARSEMDRLNLQDWEFKMNYTMSSTFGRCNSQKRLIELSAVLVAINVQKEVLDTIRHEIAHAIREKERGYPRHLTAGMWHDPRWRQIASAIGATPQQYYNQAGNRSVATGKVPVYAWKKTCPNCEGSGGLTNRRSKTKCCGRCVRETGQYFNWTYTPNK